MSDQGAAPARLTRIERELMAHRLWSLESLTYDEVATAMRDALKRGKVFGFSENYSRSTAYKDVKSAIKRLTTEYKEETEDLRQKMRARLEGVFRQAYGESRKTALNDEHRIGWSGEARATLDQLSKLDGLYAPTKVAPTNPAGDKPYEAGIDTNAMGLRAANLLASLLTKVGPDALADETDDAAGPADGSDERGTGA